MGFDKRIGMSFLQAGLGYGGSCFPKDVLSLIDTAKRLNESPELLETVVKVNQNRLGRFVSRVEKRLGNLQGKRIAVLGLAFKPNTDDLREAKSIEVIQWLLERKAEVVAYDPVAMDNCKQLLPQITYASGPYDAAEGADAILIITEWNEFKLLNLQKIADGMRKKIIFDGRNIYQPERVEKAGIKYICIGRGSACMAD